MQQCDSDGRLNCTSHPAKLGAYSHTMQQAAEAAAARANGVDMAAVGMDAMNLGPDGEWVYEGHGGVCLSQLRWM